MKFTTITIRVGRGRESSFRLGEKKTAAVKKVVRSIGDGYTFEDLLREALDYGLYNLVFEDELGISL